MKMRPPTSTIDKCVLETEKLFRAFLDVGKFTEYKETEEVEYILHDTELPNRSGSFGSLLTRGGEDVAKYTESIEEKRRSFEGSSIGSNSHSYPSLTASAHGGSTLQRDTPTPPSPAMLPAASQVRLRPSVTRDSSRPMSAPTVQAQRRRTDSTGPSEELLQEAARKIAEVGDKIEEEYKDDLNNMAARLEKFIAETGSTMTYEVFAATVNDLVGTDRNWTNLLLAMHLGKRIVSSSVSIGTNVCNHFTHFMGMAFGEEIARTGNAEQYVREHARDL